MRDKRNKIKRLLIRLANWIGDNSYYDFGDEVVGIMEYKGSLMLATKSSLYVDSEGNGKWKKIKDAS